ncbi:hypothetical protein Tco_0601180 [Tanacetum coccineum]
MTINSNIPPQIHKTQVESLKTENIKDENLHGIDNEFENRLDGTLYIRRRSRLPSKFHQWPDMEAGITTYVSKCLACLKMRDDYQKPSGLLIIAKVGTVAYRLELPKKLSRVHSTFYVSNLKKRLVDEPLAISLDEIQVDDKLHFIEERVEIMDHEVKRLKQSCIPIIKVRWNSKRGPEFTWERKNQMQKKYTRTFSPTLHPWQRLRHKL